MDFEQILPFILLLIFWGASSILRKMGKAGQKKQTSVDKKPVLVKILQQLAELKEKGNNEEFNEYFPPPSQVQATEHEKELLIEIPKDSLPEEPVITGRETIFVAPPIGLTQPRSAILQKKPMAMMNRSKLQNAVIWAEILAPPVALRDQ